MIVISRLIPTDASMMNEVLEFFAKEFHDPESYLKNKPSRGYVERLLASPSFICLVAKHQEQLVGCLVAYELVKFEQERSEVYIYDLAVSSSFRRQGVATEMIEHLKGIAKALGACVIFVQADTQTEDLPAINLYTKLGKREEVLHFDIDLD